MLRALTSKAALNATATTASMEMDSNVKVCRRQANYLTGESPRIYSSRVLDGATAENNFI